MLLYITAGGFIRMPYVVLHENAMQPVIALPPPMWPDYSPRSVGDDFSDANALMSKRRRKLVRISVGRGDENDHGSLPPVALPHRFGLWLRDRWGGAWHLFRRRSHSWFIRGRHRFVQRYNSISSDG